MNSANTLTETQHFDSALRHSTILFVIHQIVRGWCEEVHDPEHRSRISHTEFTTLSVPNWRFVSLLPVALETLLKEIEQLICPRSFVPLPATEKRNWIHEVSLRSFSARAISASWFSSSSGLSVSGAVFHATTSRIRHSSHVVNPPCLRVPNLLSRFPTVKTD